MVESVSSFIIEIWMMVMMILMMIILIMILMMITMIQMVIMMTNLYDYDDDTDDDNDHKNDNYTVAGAAPGAGVPWSLCLYHLNQKWMDGWMDGGLRIVPELGENCIKRKT